MKNFNQKNDYTKATNSLDEMKPADIPYKEHMKVVRENEALKDAIVKLTLKIMSLEKTIHPDVW